MRWKPLLLLSLAALAAVSCVKRKSLNLPVNTWTTICQTERGARRSSSFRYVPDGGYFLLWGYMGYVTEYYGNPDTPPDSTPEYDIVAFKPSDGRWTSQLPFDKEEAWSLNLPPLHLCSSYQGITTGSQRPQLKLREGVMRPDLNIVYDQVTYDTQRKRMVYFTGGRTFAYDIGSRAWSDAAVHGGPPPVLGGSLCYDPFNDQIVLAGGGHVAECGPDGKPVGYTGTWVFSCADSTWRPLGSGLQPPPRSATRLVCDTRNKVMVLFGGDGQSRYLADTWIYDTQSRTWRASKAAGSPPPRAGHFTVYDPGTGWVIIGGGYNSQDLTDMWAYDAAADRWFKLYATVPTGWYVTADLDPRENLILLTASDQPPGQDLTCNTIYSMRTTWGFYIEKSGLIDQSVTPEPQEDMLKRPLSAATGGTEPDPVRRAAQLALLDSLPANRWVRFPEPGRAAQMRTWGACSFDTRLGRIVYWGGGHCGYGGSDYDFYEVEENTWITSPLIAEYPERAWDRGVSPAGVTFGGEPWMNHGRKIYAYDPVSAKIVNMKGISLTAGYEPPCLKDYPLLNPDFGAGEDYRRSGYSKWVTWVFDPVPGTWEMLCPASVGLELTVSTPKGVMAVDNDWGGLFNKDSSSLAVFEGKKVKENAVFLLDVAARRWNKLSGAGPWPQNLYELTALVYDSRRNQLLLHGGGPDRTELWSFSLGSGRWTKLNPQVAGGGMPPACDREAVYIPGEDAMLTAGTPPDGSAGPGMYAYRPAENTWTRLEIAPPEGLESSSLVMQNRAFTYDPIHNVVLMVLGERSGDLGRAVVYGLRYNHRKAVAAPGKK
jgi:hypothetical protein